MWTQTNIFGDPIAPSHHADDLTEEAIRCRRVLAALIGRGLNGATRHELAIDLGFTPEQAGAALSELRMWQRVRKTEARRQGKAVYLAVEVMKS